MKSFAFCVCVTHACACVRVRGRLLGICMCCCVEHKVCMYERELVRAYDHLGQGSPVWGKVELARSDELIHGFFRVGVEWHLPGDHSKDDHTKAPAIHLVGVF